MLYLIYTNYHKQLYNIIIIFIVQYIQSNYDIYNNILQTIDITIDVIYVNIYNIH